MIRAFASGTGGIGLDPGPRDTKNVKNGTQKYLASLALIIHKASTGISSPKKDNFSDKFNEELIESDNFSDNY